MADFLAWSHSRISTFKNCPRELYHTQVAKKGDPARVEFFQTQPMRDGNEVDDALTARISKGTPLPPKFAPYENICASVIAAPGQKFTQLKLALDQSFTPCGYMDWGKTWVRAVWDVAVINGTHAFVGDWKNGQIRISEEQLRLFAAVGFHTFPELETIDTSYIWLKAGITSDKSYARRELPEIWSVILSDVERLQVCYRTNTWPATPVRGAKSCKYCAVNKANLCKEAQGPYG